MTLPSAAEQVDRSMQSRRPRPAQLLSPALADGLRPQVRGKFLFVGDRKLYVRGVTYGPFHPEADGVPYRPDAVERDFCRMAAHGFNTVRVYTVPPRWLLDAAARHGLRVMVGLPWEQHVTFLDSGADEQVAEMVSAQVRACARHPAVLCYVIGNEIPAGIVRWHGRRAIERHLERLHGAAKASDPEGLVTYVNYPTTEYLDLGFLDFVGFNVYLESRSQLAAYLARLQNLCVDRPLVLTEVGLDSRRNGEQLQADALDWQVRAAFESGCAGAVLFAWTDEWHRGGHDIDDWDFGLTRRDRAPKPALAAAKRAFAESPFPARARWPRCSVVVCTHNGARTLRDTLSGVAALEYPNFETVVVDDGSDDDSAAIAYEFGVRLIRTDNRGLSAARNVGLEAANGEIVAYLDDDARPDPQWLSYLAGSLEATGHAGVGGPNLAPSGDGVVAQCVANAPGGPNHVLVSDTEAEHIPGCNMAFRRSALIDVGGFDPRFRAAGDDVDLCWRLRAEDRTLGFSPGAVVWHHRRNSLLAFWRQQIGYGKAEALLERKWRDRYNALGHLAWKGRLYGRGVMYALGWPPARIYGGTWGSAPFQSLYRPQPGALPAAPLMPEWYLIVLALACFSAVGLLWPPMLLTLPLLAAALVLPGVQALLAAAHASFPDAPSSRRRRIALRCLTAVLHLVQPLARLSGRMRHGLTPWRRRGVRALAPPWTARYECWRERWEAPEEWLRSIEAALERNGAVVRRGGAWDQWDLEVRGGMLGAVQLRGAVEEHGAGCQLARLRAWPNCSGLALVALGVFAMLAGEAALDGAWTAALLLAAISAIVGLRGLGDCSAATATVRRTLREAGLERTR